MTVACLRVNGHFTLLGVPALIDYLVYLVLIVSLVLMVGFTASSAGDLNVIVSMTR